MLRGGSALPSGSLKITEMETQTQAAPAKGATKSGWRTLSKKLPIFSAFIISVCIDLFSEGNCDVSGSQREVAHSTIRTRATVEDVRQPHMEQEMAPRLYSFQDKPDAVNTDAFLLILFLILQRVFPAKRRKLSIQNRDSTYENQPRRNIAKTSKTARFKL